DALSADWCQCLSLEPSLICPACRNCFCKSHAEYKATFWNSAPQALWDKKATENDPYASLNSFPKAPELKRPAILIVDHDRHVLARTSRLVEQLGYGTVQARDGQEALIYAGRYLPELILADRLLPKIDGCELCRQVKQNSATSSTRVIVKSVPSCSSNSSLKL